VMRRHRYENGRNLRNSGVHWTPSDAIRKSAGSDASKHEMGLRSPWNSSTTGGFYEVRPGNGPGLCLKNFHTVFGTSVLARPIPCVHRDGDALRPVWADEYAVLNVLPLGPTTAAAALKKDGASLDRRAPCAPWETSASQGACDGKLL
jgi:hypothetical protein